MRNVQDNNKKIVLAENGDLKLTAYFITGKFRTFELTSNGNQIAFAHIFSSRIKELAGRKLVQEAVAKMHAFKYVNGKLKI